MTGLSQFLSDRKLVLLDSAMGTELQDRGCDVTLPLWSAKAIYEKPDTIRQIHIENVDAGADIITTNTFRTQRRTIEKAEFRYENRNFRETAFELTKLACEIALEAKMITHDELLVAGSIAPLADSYHPENTPDEKSIRKEQSEHIENLITSGVDILLAETMSCAKEIKILIELLDDTQLDYMISLLVMDSDKLFSGEPLDEILDKINNSQASALLVNCITPDTATSAFERLRHAVQIPFGIYTNVGIPEKLDSNGTVEKAIDEAKYLNYAKNWMGMGVKIIGGCCGTGPSYIKMLKKLK
jgi:S-methylmethionine-dependent homocysteine/selenocysteine methylase